MNLNEGIGKGACDLDLEAWQEKAYDRKGLLTRAQIKYGTKLMHFLTDGGDSLHETAKKFCKVTGINVEMGDDDIQRLSEFTKENGKIFTLNANNINFSDWLTLFSKIENNDFLENTTFFVVPQTAAKFAEATNGKYRIIPTEPQNNEERRMLLKEITRARKSVNNGTGNIFLMPGGNEKAQNEFDLLFEKLTRDLSNNTPVLESHTMFNRSLEGLKGYGELYLRALADPRITSYLYPETNATIRNSARILGDVKASEKS